MVLDLCIKAKLHSKRDHKEYHENMKRNRVFDMYERCKKRIFIFFIFSIQLLAIKRISYEMTCCVIKSLNWWIQIQLKKSVM